MDDLWVGSDLGLFSGWQFSTSGTTRLVFPTISTYRIGIIKAHVFGLLPLRHFVITSKKYFKKVDTVFPSHSWTLRSINQNLIFFRFFLAAGSTTRLPILFAALIRLLRFRAYATAFLSAKTSSIILERRSFFVIRDE